jgi:hypothetical protein
VSSRSNARIIAAVIVAAIVVGGLIGYSYYTTSANVASLSRQNASLSQQEASQAQELSSLAESSSTATSGGLYIASVDFSGGNVTVNLGNSGGGVPTPPGYGDTGVTGQFIGAIIIQDGSVYYHYNWNCQLNTPCALAPGPFRYFTLTQKDSGVTVAWNVGNSALVPDILSVGGSLSAGMIFPWTSGANYMVYLQSNDNLIVYQASFTAP